MGMDVLEVNTPGELVLWLHLVQSKVSMGQNGAEIILDYMAEHGMTLAVHNQELSVLDAGEESPEYKPYSIDDAIHDVCEWNLELIQDMEDGMKNPADQKEYNRFSDALDILKKQEKVLDGLYQQTKYEQMAQECALEVIRAALGSVPEEVQARLESYRKGENGQPEEESRQEESLEVQTEKQELWQRGQERGR